MENKTKAMTKGDLIKEFEAETGWRISGNFSYHKNGEYTLPEADYWKAFSEWQSDKLLKAREDMSTAGIVHSTFLEITNRELEAEVKDLQQELERVKLSKSLLAFELKTLQGFHTELYNKVEADETIEPITKYVSPEDLDELTNNQ